MNPISRRLVLALLAATCAALSLPAADFGGGTDVPHVTHLGFASPTILQLSLADQQVIPGPQVPYVAEPGDQVTQPKPPGEQHRYVTRRGQVIGTLVGPRNDTLWTWDVVTGSALDPAWADAAASYELTSPTDPAYRTPQAPVRVFRKSKPNDYARAGLTAHVATLRHEVFLLWPHPLTPGREYTLTFAGHPWPAGTLPPVAFSCDPARLRSQAVHMSQIGFDPDDPAKVAFLSTWMGTGGRLDYAEGTEFQVLDDATGKPVFAGRIALQKAANATEIGSLTGAKNVNQTNVYQMDFTPVRTPGRYRVSVAGIGCSYPFTIGDGVWEDAFKVSVKALYNKRAGIALDTRYTNYARPRDHHPDDFGNTVRLTTAPLIDTTNGLDRNSPSAFGPMVAGLLPPDQKLGSEAYGGYHDAGDWDRRIQHLEAPIWLFTLVSEVPAYFEKIRINLPESGGPYPDLVAEALWGIDFYRRLQLAAGPDAGAVRGGIEYSEHPRLGEASWQDTNLMMAYAPDPWSSYWYAAAASMAARWLESHGHAEAAAGYRASAEAAYRWAAAQPVARYKHGSDKDVADTRNFAAAALFRLTGTAAYQEDFMGTTDFRTGAAGTTAQKFGAWEYVRTDRPGMDAAVKAHITASFVADADRLVRGCADTGFRWTMFPSWFYGLGALSASLEAPTLVKAHVLTHDPAYFRTLELSCQTGAGANPDNRCYTTSLGANPVVRPLDADSRYFREMATPPGLTVLGPADSASGLTMPLFAPYYYPADKAWPIIECYHDVWLDPYMTEYTIQLPITQNFVAWGYLAAVHHSTR